MAASEVAVKFSADMGGLQAGVDKAKGLFDQFAGSVRSSASSMQSSFRDLGDKANDASSGIGDFASKTAAAIGKLTLGFGALAVAGVAAIEEVGRNAINIVEPIRQAAGAFDQTMQSISATNGIAARAGLGLTALGTSFQTLQVHAREGDAQTVAALNAIGLKASEVAGLSQEQLAVKMAEAFSTAKDSANKTAAAVALFGADVAGKLVPLLDRGADAMKALEAATDRAGLKLGDDLKAKIQGTASLFADFSSTMKELRDSVQGGVLQTFQQIKPAIDGLILSFTTVIRNVTDLYQWFNQLNGAGQQNITSTGILADVAKRFSLAIIDATTWVQTFVVKGVQGLADYGVSFQGLLGVATAFFKDFVALATSSSDTFYKVYRAAIDGVVAAFGDLARAGSAALSFDFTGIKSALSDFQSRAAEAGGKIKGSFDGAFAGTTEAMRTMQVGAAATAKALDPVLDKLAAQNAAARKMIEDGGKVGTGQAQTRNVGSSKVGDDGGADRDAVSAAQKAIDGQIRVLQRGLQEKLAIYEADVQAFGGSETQKVLKVKAAVEDEYQGELALLQKRKEIDGQTLAQRQETENKIADLVVKHRTTMLQVEVDGIKNLQARWAEGLGSIVQSFNSQMRGVLNGTQSFGQAIKGMFGDLVLALVQACEQMAVKWAAMELGKTTASLLGISERQGAETAGQAVSEAGWLASALKKIAAAIGETIAGVTANQAPLVGPFAPAEGIAAGATVAAASFGAFSGIYDTGAFRIGRDQFAAVHADEMVVPSRGGIAPEFRQFMANGGFKGRGAGGDTHNHNWNVPGVYDTAGFIKQLENSASPLAKIVAQTFKKQPSLRPAF